LGKDEGERVTEWRDKRVKGRGRDEGKGQAMKGRGQKDEGKEWMFYLPVMVHT